MAQFEDFNPSTESYWHSFILFNKNVASYKFALGKSLFELPVNEKTAIAQSWASL